MKYQQDVENERADVLKRLSIEAGDLRKKLGRLSALNVGDAVYSARSSIVCYAHEDGTRAFVGVREHTVVSLTPKGFRYVPVGEPNAKKRWFSFRTNKMSATRRDAIKHAMIRARRCVEHNERRLNDARMRQHALEHEVAKCSTE